MKHEDDRLANSAWISRFWAQYSKLPETLKDGFYSLVLNISKEIEIENECSEQRINNRTCIASEGNCRI